jgi:HlyD family secretion protein
MKKKKDNSKKLIIILLIVAAVLVIAALVLKKGPELLKVSTETVSVNTITEKVSASGKIFPVTEVKISSPVSGEVVELNIVEGDSVRQGQILAKIDPEAYQSQVERGTASVNASKANMANSKAQLENIRAQKEQVLSQLLNAKEVHKRNEKLFKEGVISTSDFEASLVNLQSLEANIRASEASIKSAQQNVLASEYSIKSAEASLKELKTMLGRTTIVAPVSGVVSKLNVEKGEQVVGTVQMSGTELMRIANLNSMEVQVEVSESDIPRVNIGDVVDVEVDAYIDRIFKGEVRQIANSANNLSSGLAGAVLNSDQVTNFVVTIDILRESYDDLINSDNRFPFRPGMSANVEINTSTVENILTVPVQSVTVREFEEDAERLKRDDSYNPRDERYAEVVFIVDADSVRMLEVSTGLQDAKFIHIKQGLEEGMVVVTAPYSAISKKLEEGEQVQIVDEDDLYKVKD